MEIKSCAGFAGAEEETITLSAYIDFPWVRTTRRVSGTIHPLSGSVTVNCAIGAQDNSLPITYYFGITFAVYTPKPTLCSATTSKPLSAALAGTGVFPSSIFQV